MKFNYHSMKMFIYWNYFKIFVIEIDSKLKCQNCQSNLLVLIDERNGDNSILDVTSDVNNTTKYESSLDNNETEGYLTNTEMYTTANEEFTTKVLGTIIFFFWVFQIPIDHFLEWFCIYTCNYH